MRTSKKNDAKHIPDELYKQIIQVIPIACVDVIVENKKGEVLLLKRNNSPAKGQWWFPGGRVHFMETRTDAALRKLQEECGLSGHVIKEIGTFDLLLEDGNRPSHGITTVSLLGVENSDVRTDEQSLEHAWKLPGDWLKIVKSDFIRMILGKIYF